MKNLLKTFGIIAVVAIIGLSMAACKEEEGGGGKTNFGDKLEFSGEQVYVMENNYDEFIVSLKPYTGADVTFENIYGATPKITGGKFSFSVGEPLSSDLEGFYLVIESLGFTNVKVSDGTAKFAFIIFFFSREVEYYLTRLNYNINVTGTGEDAVYSGTSSTVYFFYVDKPVTITATGGTESWTGRDSGIPYTNKLNDLNISLAAGWNTVCNKSELLSGSKKSGSYTTTTVSVSNPSSLIWLLDEYLRRKANG